MTHAHLSEYELQRILDLSAEEKTNDESFRHLQSCMVCKERFRALEMIHTTLNEQKIEPSDERGVEKIMQQVRSGHTDSLMVPILQRFAYVIALVLVLGIVGIVFYQFDVIDYAGFQLETDEAVDIFGGAYTAVQEQFITYSNLLAEVFDRVFGAETFPVFSFTVVLLLLLAALDRLLLAPILRRGR